jgi:hypothetical protein
VAKQGAKMNSYVREYLKKDCSGQLQELFSQSNNPYKEISENMAAFAHLRDIVDITDEHNTFMCVGDGSLCLTGALFAFLTKGNVISIDPVININKVSSWMERERVKRFMFYKMKYQQIGGWNEPCIFVLVHAHVNLEELAAQFPGWKYIYTCPCCNYEEQTFSLAYQKKSNISVVLAGRDTSMITPKNDVFIYRNNNHAK